MTPDPAPDDDVDLSKFEESIRKLESLVEEMEGDRLPLNELIAHYESGTRLIRHCEGILSTARKRIELINLSQHDPGHATDDADADDEDTHDDIRLT